MKAVTCHCLFNSRISKVVLPVVYNSGELIYSHNYTDGKVCFQFLFGNILPSCEVRRIVAKTLGGISISFFDYQINCLPSKNFWEIMVRLGTVLKVKTYSRFTRELAHFKVSKFDRPWSFCFSGILACFTACFLTFTVAFFIPPGLKACEVDV